MKKTIKKTAKKMAMKKMFAVVQTILNSKDLDDSEVTICGVYSTRKIAKQNCANVMAKFFMTVDSKDFEHAKQLIEDDRDHLYGWYVAPVNVEA